MDPAYARTERGCGQVGLGLADCGGGAVVQRSRIHSVDMSALTTAVASTMVQSP